MTGAAGGKPLPLNPTLVPGERTRSCQTQDLFDSSPSNKTSNPYMASNPLPTPYYFIFGIYEPLSLILSCIWAAFNPVEAFNAQAPWATPNLVGGAEPTDLSVQEKVTLLQLIAVLLTMALINISVIHTTRRYLAHDPAAQEIAYRSLLGVLMFSDFAHTFVTLYGMGPEMRWAFGRWSGLTWLTVGVNITLLVPRALWHLGVGRDVGTRSPNTRERKQI